jgi:MSHA biogenesis protein MshP
MIIGPVRTQGFTLISTLFLIVVVAGLGGYLVNLSVAQHQASAMTINMARARFAAMAGLELIAYRIANVSNKCPATPVSLEIQGFAVTLTACSETDVVEGADSFRLFDVELDAGRGGFGDTDHVSYALRATLRG